MCSILLAATLVFSPENAALAYGTAARLVGECTPRDAGTIRGGIAANRILDWVSVLGVDIRRDPFTAETPEGPRRFVNLYSEFKSNPTGRWVVVVSHYDTKPGVACPGANDGASTTGLLVGLAAALSSWEMPKGNLLLVWTDGEECLRSYAENDGLQGAKRAVEYIRKRHYDVQAVIVLDMLGDRDLAISVPANGSEALAKIAVCAAERAGFAGLVTRVPDIVKDDHLPFLQAGMKAIDMIDFSYGPDNAYWHGADDTMEHVSEDSLLKSGRVLAEILNILLRTNG